MIYENHQFENIGELMLGGDHYKWRVMLSNGVDEKFIRGDASWHDKWLAFAASLKYCIGNPMFHWTHLELRRVFGIEDIPVSYTHLYRHLIRKGGRKRPPRFVLV